MDNTFVNVVLIIIFCILGAGGFGYIWWNGLVAKRGYSGEPFPVTAP